MSATKSPATIPDGGTLRELVASYLPSIAIGQLFGDQELARPRADLQTGTILFADMCGFTALTEHMEEQGKAGVEELTALLNRYYALMLRLVARYDGMLIRFGGDSLLILFSGADHVIRAAGCALAMQHGMRQRFSSHQAAVNSPEVHMAIALHSSAFVSAHLGLPDERLEYLLTGPEVQLTLQIRQAAGADEILLSPSTLAQLPDYIQVQHGPRWSKLWIPHHPLELPANKSQAVSQPLSMIQEELLARYLPEPLRTRVSTSLPQRWREGEHRRITVLFIEIVGPSVTLQRSLETPLSPNQNCPPSLAILHEYLLHTDRMARRHGGCLIRCDATTRGERFLLLFGAPTMQERNTEHAVLCALDILSNPRWTGEMVQRCSIATGFAFCGDVGTPTHREYTVMGNVINLAARLVGQARPQDILLDEATWHQLRDSCHVQQLGLLALKGKREPTAAYRLLGYAPLPAVMDTRSPSIFVGRHQELEYLQALGDQARAGQGQTVMIQGPAGIGKTRLLREFSEQWTRQHGRVIWQTCYHYSPTPLQPWQEILARIQQAPALVVFDDLQWADQASAQLILKCVPRPSSHPIFLALLFRGTVPADEVWVALKDVSRLTLPELSFSDSFQLAGQMLGVPRLGSLLEQTLLRQAGGNPLFVQELLCAFQQAGMLLIDHQAGVAELQHSGSVPIPNSLEALVLGRIDRLSPVSRELIKAAAAIRPIVHFPLLQAILPRSLHDETIIKAGLQELWSAHLLIPDWRRPESHYHFVHELIREIVYESLSTKRRLHIQLQLQNHPALADRAEGTAHQSAA